MATDKLTLLWTNADPVTAELMVFMYARASIANGWWQDVEIIVWGATAKLVAENDHIRKKLIELKDNGIKVIFCIACARALGVDDLLASFGFELDFMGEPLTALIKSKAHLITI